MDQSKDQCGTSSTKAPHPRRSRPKKKKQLTAELGFGAQSPAFEQREEWRERSAGRCSPVGIGQAEGGVPSAADDLNRGPSFFGGRQRSFMDSIVKVKPHMESFWQGLYHRASGFIRRQDIYGKPVMLNYQGEETYKTCPGGCLSLLLFFTILCYFVLKFKYMIFKEEWQLIQQTVVSELADFEVTHRFADASNANISLGLQFYKKKEKQTVADQLSALDDKLKDTKDNGFGDDDKWRLLQTLPPGPPGFDPRAKQVSEIEIAKRKALKEQYIQIQRAAKYLEINAMVELKNGTTFRVFNSKVNSDVYTWKRYNDSMLYQNQHEMLELKFNLSDAAIKGTENHLQQMEVVNSRFQVRYDLDQTKIDAYLKCLGNSTCAQLVGDSVPAILKKVYEETFKGYDKMTAAEKASATKTFNFMQELAESPDEAKKIRLYDGYYLKYLPVHYKSLETERNTMIQAFAMVLKETATPEDFAKYDQAKSISDVLVLFKDKLKAINATAYEMAVSLTDEIDSLKARAENYKTSQEEYVNDINSILAQFDIELVIYDEVEYFRDTSDKQFNYPFQQRKNKVRKLSFQSSDSTDDVDSGDYKYPKQTLKFQPSLACLEPSVLEQLNFIQKLIQDIITVVDRVLSGTFTAGRPQNQETIGLEKCPDKGFLKLKYVSSQEQTLSYLDDYEKGVISNRILLEVQLEMDAFKTESLRTSTQILDFLGDMGGFYQAVDLMIFMIAEYFSARFFLASIAANLYLLKDSRKNQIFEQIKQGFLSLFVFKPKKEEEDLSSEPQAQEEFSKTVNGTKENYKTIHIRPAHLIFDPVLKSMTDWCRSCCRKKAFLRREKVLEQCSEKFTDELEITALLGKLRDLHEMFKYLKTRKQQKLLAYHEDRVIQLSDNSDDASSDDSYGARKLKSQETLKIETNLKFNDCVAQDIENAINFSIVQGVSMNAKKKNQFLEMMNSERDQLLPLGRSSREKDAPPIPTFKQASEPLTTPVSTEKLMKRSDTLSTKKTRRKSKRPQEIELTDLNESPIGKQGLSGNASRTQGAERTHNRQPHFLEGARTPDLSTIKAPDTSMDVFLPSEQDFFWQNDRMRRQELNQESHYPSANQPPTALRPAETSKRPLEDLIEETGATKRRGRSRKKRSKPGEKPLVRDADDAQSPSAQIDEKDDI